MKVEVLASVMNASLPETVQHMNLQSDAVIINQCDRLGQEEMQISQGNGRIRFYSFPERGIGRSRNEAILRAEGDICLFSDEDIVYEDGYAAAVCREFEQNPRADMIIFNITVEEERRTYHITERKQVHWYNCGRYGAVSPPGKLITFRNYVFPAVWRWRQVQQRRGQSVFNAVY